MPSPSSGPLYMLFLMLFLYSPTQHSASLCLPHLVKGYSSFKSQALKELSLIPQANLNSPAICMFS